MEAFAVTRARYAALTAGASLVAGTVAIFMLNAPFGPVGLGMIAAFGLLMLRKPPQ